MLSNSAITVLIACFNTTTKRVDYFSNHEIIPEVLRASKAMPVVYGKQVMINGDLYTDSPLSPLQMIHDNKKSLGEKIVCIDIRETNPILKFISKLLIKSSKEVAATSTNIMMISPTNISCHLLSRSKSTLEKTFNQGYQYSISHKEQLLKYIEY